MPFRRMTLMRMTFKSNGTQKTRVHKNDIQKNEIVKNDIRNDIWLDNNQHDGIFYFRMTVDIMLFN